MDREALTDGIPSGTDWVSLPVAGRKKAAEELIHRILEALASERREPDAWEASDLALAIGLAVSGKYAAAVAYADRAMTPEEERGGGPFTINELPTLRHLEHGLAELQGLPPIQID